MRSTYKLSGSNFFTFVTKYDNKVIDGVTVYILNCYYSIKPIAYTVGVRLYLVYLVALGHSSRKLSELLHISFKQITNWAHRFEENSIEGLKDRKGRGRRSTLSADQLIRIKSLILTESPGDYGLRSERWTGPLLLQWIKNKYGLEYQKAQVYNLLDKVGIAFEKKCGLVEKVQLIYILFTKIDEEPA